MMAFLKSFLGHTETRRDRGTEVENHQTAKLPNHQTGFSHKGHKGHKEGKGEKSFSHAETRRSGGEEMKTDRTDWTNGMAGFRDSGIPGFRELRTTGRRDDGRGAQGRRKAGLGWAAAVGIAVAAGMLLDGARGARAA